MVGTTSIVGAPGPLPFPLPRNPCTPSPDDVRGLEPPRWLAGIPVAVILAFLWGSHRRGSSWGGGWDGPQHGGHVRRKFEVPATLEGGERLGLHEHLGSPTAWPLSIR